LREEEFAFHDGHPDDDDEATFTVFQHTIQLAAEDARYWYPQIRAFAGEFKEKCEGL
jgi:hypothetical protein